MIFGNESYFAGEIKVEESNIATVPCPDLIFNNGLGHQFFERMISIDFLELRKSRIRFACFF